MDCEFGFVEGFDKVKWEHVWEALSEHGVSDHMLWVLQSIYYGQMGRIEHNNTDGDQGRRATRMRIESAVVLVCFGSGPWMLASEGWQCWRGDAQLLFVESPIWQDHRPCEWHGIYMYRTYFRQVDGAHNRPASPAFSANKL